MPVCVCVFKGRWGGGVERSVVLTPLLHYACWQPCLSPLKAHLVSPLYLLSALIELFVWHLPLYQGCYNPKVRAGTTCPAAAHPPRAPPRSPSDDKRCLISLQLWVVEVEVEVEVCSVSPSISSHQLKAHFFPCFFFFLPEAPFVGLNNPNCGKSNHIPTKKKVFLSM